MATMIPLKAHRIKVAITGPRGCGKSTFTHKVCYGSASQKIPPTIGVDHHGLTVKFQKMKIPLMLWDCSSSYKYRELVIDAYSPFCDAIIGVYDCNKMGELEQTITWLKEMQSKGHTKTMLLIASSFSFADANDDLLVKGKESAQELGFMFRRCSIPNDSVTDLKNIITAVVDDVLKNDQERLKALQDLDLYNRQRKRIKG